jgi:hypothetical protein
LAEPDDVAVEPMAIQQLREQIRQLNAIPNPHPAIATAINDLEQQLETALQQWRTGAAEVSGLQDILAEVGADPGYWEGLPKGAILLHFGVLVDRAILLDGSLAEVRLNC